MSHFRHCVELYRAWSFYRKKLVQETATLGHPVMRHLILHYPDDEVVPTLRYQYLLGEDLLVAPALDTGGWTQVWTGDVVEGTEGSWHESAAPFGEPPLYLRRGSTNEASLREAFASVRAAE